MMKVYRFFEKVFALVLLCLCGWTICRRRSKEKLHDRGTCGLTFHNGRTRAKRELFTGAEYA